MHSSSTLPLVTTCGPIGLIAILRECLQSRTKWPGKSPKRLACGLRKLRASAWRAHRQPTLKLTITIYVPNRPLAPASAQGCGRHLRCTRRRSSSIPLLQKLSLAMRAQPSMFGARISTTLSRVRRHGSERMRRQAVLWNSTPIFRRPTLFSGSCRSLIAATRKP